MLVGFPISSPRLRSSNSLAEKFYRANRLTRDEARRSAADSPSCRLIAHARSVN
jgi:hypothetical protein